MFAVSHYCHHHQFIFCGSVMVLFLFISCHIHTCIHIIDTYKQHEQDSSLQITVIVRDFYSALTISCFSNIAIGRNLESVFL